MVEALSVELGQKVVEAMQWYALAVVAAFMLGAVIWRSHRGKIGTFVIVVNLFAITFVVVALGVAYLLIDVLHLEQTISLWGVFVAATLTGALALFVPYYPLKILFAPYETIGADISRIDTRLLSPLDLRRQEYMARKHKRRP